MVNDYFHLACFRFPTIKYSVQIKQYFFVFRFQQFIGGNFAEQMLRMRTAWKSWSDTTGNAIKLSCWLLWWFFLFDVSHQWTIKKLERRMFRFLYFSSRMLWSNENYIVPLQKISENDLMKDIFIYFNWDSSLFVQSSIDLD